MPKIARHPLVLSTLAAAIALSLSACTDDDDPVAPAFKSIAFTATPAAKTEAEMLETYSTSEATITYEDGSTERFPLTYHSLFRNTDQTSEAGIQAQRERG